MVQKRNQRHWLYKRFLRALILVFALGLFSSDFSIPIDSSFSSTNVIHHNDTLDLSSNPLAFGAFQGIPFIPQYNIASIYFKMSTYLLDSIIQFFDFY